MKNLTSVIVMLFAICITSCVNRIDIPEDEAPMLYIKLEILKDQTEVSAEFKTTNNLNGTYPINTPNSAEIVIREFQSSDVAKYIELDYDETLGKYTSDRASNKSFLISGKKYLLEAGVENTTLPAITSTTLVPHAIGISDYELLEEKEVEDNDGNIFWQGRLGITFNPTNPIVDNYGHLQIYGFKTKLVISLDGDTTYVNGNDLRFFELAEVYEGNKAITDIIHRDGFFIDFTDLSDNYLEVVLQSPFPITEENQVTDFLDTKIISISEEHYDYHIALHNIKSNEGSIFDESALYRSNIEKGLGLFSSCVEMPQKLKLRK